MDLPDPEVEPASGLLIATSVIGVIPVVLGIELPGVRFVEGKIDEHLSLLGIDLVVLVLVQIGNGLLLFSLKDELEGVWMNALGLASFFGFLVVDFGCGGLAEQLESPKGRE